MYDALGRDSVHPFPARMAPTIALEVLENSKRPLRILDPMMGSGTVIALARANGHQARGIDIDPLAVLLSKVWTTAVDIEHINTVAKNVLAIAEKSFPNMPLEKAYPIESDDETKEFIDYWFDPIVRRQMTSLSNAILAVEDEDERDVLWCALSRLIIVKSSGVSLAMDLSHSRPHRVYEEAPVRPFDKFLPMVLKVTKSCLDKKDKARGPVAKVARGDARKLPIRKSSIDIVLTSPPYLNAIDYMRCSKFSLVWMGYKIGELRKLRTDSIGSELSSGIANEDESVKLVVKGLNLQPRLTTRNQAILSRYIYDMTSSIKEVARVLVPNGKAIYVVGENTIKGTYIRNSVVMEIVAKQVGLALTEKKVRILPANRRYLPPPTKRSSKASMDARMRREVVMTFTKLAI